MAFDRGTKLFIQKSSGVFIVRTRHLDAEIVCFDCATHSKTGVVLPCVLMRTKKHDGVVEHVLLSLHSSDRFEQCCRFKLDYELKEDVRLFTGPSVLWRHASKLFYISSDTCTVLSAPVQLSSVVWTGEIEGEGTVVLGIRAACLPECEDGDEFSTSDRAIWGSEFFGYAIERQKMLTGTLFLPHAYSRVVSSVCVCKNEILKKQLRISAVAITHKNQLIWFQDGVPKGVCELPYEKPRSIKTAVTSSNDLLFIVSFSSGNICVVRRENLQVTTKWQKVKSVLVDDFIGSGTEQLLLLVNDDSNTDVLNTFKITDFGKVNYESGINYKDDVPAAEGLQGNGSMEDILAILAVSIRFSFQIVSSDCTLTRCLHSLTRALPPSCDVKLLKCGSKSVLTEQLALALEKEMFTSRSFLSSKQSKAENNLSRWNELGKKISDPPVASLLNSEDGVQQFRKKLQNEREECMLSMNEMVDGSLYQEMALKVAEAQLSSDLIVWRLSKS
ncbi:hypothetical protein ASZ78_008528 [Callipepla squamata]|uniref:Fanconi anemia group B protein n=1 Tax=Callipepla squamata TaxID=9009 RepID=A0A226NDB9_CALSU|nr:hypothetical protein ASZ78_008528 [Callipepla squamata]